MTRFVPVVALLVLSATAALAGEGNGNAFPPGPVPAAVGVNAIPMLPSAGSQAEVATVNSAPPGFEEGTQADQRADAVRAYFGRTTNATVRDAAASGVDAGG